jgi:hypothetical protein
MRHHLPTLTALAALACTFAHAPADPPPPPGKAAEPTPFERALTLSRKGKHAEALAALQAARQVLPANARLSRWSLDFQRRAVPVVLVGAKYLYFTTHCSRREKPSPPALPDSRPVLNDSKMRYDFKTVITCAEAATGKKLWTRQTQGHFDLAIDPRNDNLYVWRGTLFRLDPKTGEVAQTKDLPRGADRVKALLFAGRPYLPNRDRGLPVEDSGGPVRAWDVDGGKAVLRDVLAPVRISPDERRMLRVTRSTRGGVSTVLAARPLKDTVKPWKYEHPDDTFNEPFWLDDDVVALCGAPGFKAQVVRLDGATGKLKWRFALPRGAYVAGMDQLSDGAYPPRTWSAVGKCGDYLLAVGSEGALYFLDPATGKLLGKATPGTSHLAFPRLVDGALVVSSIQGIRAIPLDVLLRRRADGEREVTLLEARCLKALGKTQEALARLRELLKLDPESVEGWLLRAELARRAKLPEEEVAARCRRLELTGEEVSPDLRARWGLLKRVATHNDITNNLRRLGDVVCAATYGGWFYGIDVRSLEVVVKKEFPAAFMGIRRSETLKGYFTDREYRDVAEQTDDGPQLAPRPPGDRATGNDGHVVRWRGKFYRPLAGGNVRVLDGKTTTEHKTPLEGIKQWQIHVSPSGVLGYGHGGVYALDEHLCPVRKLIGGRGRDADSPFDVSLLASDSRTVGLLAWHRGEYTLQVWTRDGKKKLREQVVLPQGYLHGGAGRLVPLAGGYLLSGCELVWIPPSPGVPVWRFGFEEEPGTSLPKIPFAHTTLFGWPLVCDNLLFVTCRDGGIYVFDVTAITRPRQR